MSFGRTLERNLSWSRALIIGANEGCHVGIGCSITLQSSSYAVPGQVLLNASGDFLRTPVDIGVRVNNDSAGRAARVLTRIV